MAGDIVSSGIGGGTTRNSRSDRRMSNDKSL
jgi:hypothetical protein